ncbi:MAG: hypothetical protein K1X79_13910 [Oligoflexia bacterium]|nr:hypothetical protein [Oligoflexia bacterium]
MLPLEPSNSLGVGAYNASSPPVAHILSPPFPSLAQIASTHEQNARITDWYHRVDRVMTEYLGTPEVPSWARFAKWASYNAGEQLRNIEEGLQVFRAMENSFRCVRAAMWNTRVSEVATAVKSAIDFSREVFDLFKHDGLVGEAIVLALSEAGMSEKDRQVMSENIGRRCPKSMLIRAYILAKNFPRLVHSIDAIAQTLTGMHASLIAANRAIFEFMAPRLSAFLDAAAKGSIEPSSGAPDITERFFSRALSMYAQARQMGLRAQTLPLAGIDRAELLETRRNLVAEANLLATFGEQLYRAQPQFDRMADFLKRSTRFMRMHFPGSDIAFGAGAAPRDWGLIYDRMGVDVRKAPADPHELRHDVIFPLCRRDDPRFLGTIGHLLTLGMERPELALALKREPPRLLDACRHC